MSILNKIRLKIYINRKLKNYGYSGSKDYGKILKEYSNLSDYRIIFVYCPLLDDNNQLNANSTLKGTITVNALWAAHLVFASNKINKEDVKAAFIMTIGHEEGHKDFKLRIPLFGLSSSDHKFVSWVNEVYADYYGICNKVDGNINTFKRTVYYKIMVKESESKKEDKDSSTHPSWEKRIYYASKAVLNKHLIKEIAKDTGCTNDELIEKVIDKVPKIELGNTD